MIEDESERLTVQWVARTCPLQAFLELLTQTCWVSEYELLVIILRSDVKVK